MHRRRLFGVALVAVATLSPTPPVWGQRLTAVEAGVGAVAVAARHTFAGAGLDVAYRAGQTRVALAVAAGAQGADAAARTQVTVQFMVTPAARGGAGLYGGLGVAIAGRRGSPGGGYLTCLVGLEGTPGRRGGWFAELGLAGGARVAVGWRGRRFPAWWRG